MDKSPEHQHMPCFFPNKTAGSDKKRNRKEVNQIPLIVGGRTQWMGLPICIHTFFPIKTTQQATTSKRIQMLEFPISMLVRSWAFKRGGTTGNNGCVSPLLHVNVHGCQDSSAEMPAPDASRLYENVLPCVLLFLLGHSRAVLGYFFCWLGLKCMCQW